MLIGPLWGSVVARLAIHSWSSHWWNWSVTTEAVAVGTSVARAIGSAFWCQEPSAKQSSNL